MTARSRSLLVALALVVAASVVAAPVASASGPESSPASDAADAAANGAAADTAAYPHSFWHVTPETTATPGSCTPAFGVVDATTNATTVGASVGFGGDTPQVGGALAAVTVDSTASDADERAAATRTRRLHRQLALPSTACGTR